ncbi:unnamed protein product [Clavelina lepadiformis]|uniref:protein-tyrosine-phosphatase n=1 Tax=Clavelina lepadiformis TaxID=159417 RepID=A0ABP0H0E8_CLALP
MRWFNFIGCYVFFSAQSGFVDSRPADKSNLPSTIAFSPNENVTGVCANPDCPGKRFCVPDENFERGYRCCKKSNCSGDDWRRCDDPGEVEHAKRVPVQGALRRKNRLAFRVTESVVYTCLLGYHYPKMEHVLNCTRNGSWTERLPQCLKIPLDPTPAPDPPLGRSSNTVAIIGSIIALCVILVTFVSFLMWRRWKQTGGYTWPRRESSIVLENSHKPPPLQPMALKVGAVSAADFAQYVAIHHNNNDQRFTEEFEEIQNELTQLTYEASMITENKEKNRYTNIVAYDHSRVHLHHYRSRQHANLHRSSDYINANYVSSYSKPKAYIACQGPLPYTFNDFWKMIWENNTSTIVMITNLVEKGRRKCDQYWPQEGKEQYKHITVTLKGTETLANFTIRTFSVKNNKLRRNARGVERRVVQYHFTQWPDHGAPEYLLPVLSFIHRSSVANPLHAGPIVIHCSAGVGRTGTYIVIHSMIQMLQATGHVNIKDFLHYIRNERSHLVQTEDQYVFVHEALLEYIMSGITECSLLQLAKYYKKLTASTTVTQSSQNTIEGDVGSAVLRSGLEKQFMKVVYSRTDYLDYDIATRSVNAGKNRPGAVLPVFRSRVLLCNRTSAEGSDYINASFVQGYRNSHEFVITQLPMPNTKKDFWRLIWDHNCPTIVTIMDSDWNPESEVYWPELDQPLHCSSFNVSFSSETITSSGDSDCDVITRDFILEATKDDYVLVVKQFQLSSWNKEEPSRAQLDAVRAVVEFTSGKDGSTVIQDRCGSTAAIQFACWHLMQSQLDNENRVDVYQTAMVACQMRPRVFTAPLHLKFLYEAVLLEAKVRQGQNNHSAVDTNGSAVTESEGMNGVCSRNTSTTSANDSPSCPSDDANETACLVVRPQE